MHNGDNHCPDLPSYVDQMSTASAVVEDPAEQSPFSHLPAERLVLNRAGCTGNLLRRRRGETCDKIGDQYGSVAAGSKPTDLAPRRGPHDQSVALGARPPNGVQ